MTVPSRGYSELMDGLTMNRQHWLIFGVCAAGFAFDAFDFQLMALAAPAIAKDWHLTPARMGAILSVTVIGMAIGAVAFGAVSDRFGRRRGFQLTIGLFGLFCGLSAFAQNVEQLAVLRFLTGVGIGGLAPIDTAIMTEFMPRAHRGRLVALWAAFFPLGGILASLAAWAIGSQYGWRPLFLVGVAPAIMILLVRLLIPESPRYLLSQKRDDEARAAIGWLAGYSIPKTAESAFRAVKMGTPEEPSRAGLRTLFSAAYRRRTIMAWVLWIGWSFSYFGMLLWLPSLLGHFRQISGPAILFYISSFLGAGIAGRLLVTGIIDRFGRPHTISAFGVLAALSLLIFSQQMSGSTLLLWGMLFSFFQDGGLSAITPYTPELYPTKVRGAGVGYAIGAGRIASVVAPVAVGFLLPSGPTPIFLMFAAGYLVSAVVVLIYGVETAGLALEEASLETSTLAPDPSQIKATNPGLN